MKAFFLMVVLVAAAVADEAVKVDEKPLMAEAKADDKMAAVEGAELGSRTGAVDVDVGERSAVPAAPIYPTPHAAHYWPYYVPLAAPSQLARADPPAVPYYPYSYPYTYPYPYYYAPAVVVAPPPAPAVKKLY